MATLAGLGPIEREKSAGSRSPEGEATRHKGMSVKHLAVRHFGETLVERLKVGLQEIPGAWNEVVE